ncbi:hypothetical protein HWV62_387 [Athelia sp. TMB]|nr:hypothetical protein HWV62_387 [Athelia sp. TMB]
MLSPGPRGRPRLPLGPRTLNKPQQHPRGGLTLDTSASPSSSHLATSSPSHSPLSRQTPSSPAHSFAPIAPPFSPDGVPPSYAESPYPLVESPIPFSAAAATNVLTGTLDVGVQTSPISSSQGTPNVEAKPAVKLIPKAVTLVPPPHLNFDTVPIPFKGLPLEAAQWTLSSSEFQEVVARAIRLSARESFIRIHSIETLDKSIPEEQARLETLKVTTQSQYRFQVYRRTMLLQALNSSAGAIPHDPNAVCSLAGQLSETTAACDRLMEELLRISDQQAQIVKVLDLHWASALAIALRKINKSYEKRVGELRVAQDRVEVLEAELKEAWKEAEDIAQEMDEIEETVWEDDDITTHTAHVVGVTGTATASEAKLMDSKEASSSQIFQKLEQTLAASESPTTGVAGEESQTGSCSRSHSRSRSRSVRVIAARTRSRRTSDASLRVTKRSVKAEGRTPPVPKIPVVFDSEENFLDIDTGSPSTPRVPSHKRDKPHPYSSGGSHSSSSTGHPASDVPSFWISADTPKNSPRKRASVQQQRSQPLMRRDSGGRSNSRYSHLVKPQTSRHSLPPLQGSSDGYSLH